MSDDLRDISERLLRDGLTGPAFDIAAIAEDLAGWASAGKELDRLIENLPDEDPTSFDPDWR